MVAGARRALPLPPALTVLVSPRETFLELAIQDRGFGNLFWMLALEFLLIYPLSVATALLRLGATPLAAVSALWSQYLGYALGPAAIVFGGAIILSSLARWRSLTRLETWAAASVLTYAYVPHVVVTALGVALAAVGLDSALFPHHPLATLGASRVLVAGQILVRWGPSTALAAVAIRGLLGKPPPERPASTWRARSVLGASLAVLVTALGATGVNIAHNWRLARPALPGDKLEAFTLVGLEGGTFSSASLSGQVALIDFWATWCPACVASMPVLDRLHRELSADAFSLVSVNVEPTSPAEVRDFVSQHGISFPIWVDSGNLQRVLKVQSYPTAFLVDRSGTIRKVYVGATPVEELRADIQALLADASVAPRAP
jgi:thiol-disulfide isomerase/thioredoxin